MIKAINLVAKVEDMTPPTLELGQILLNRNSNPNPK